MIDLAKLKQDRAAIQNILEQYTNPPSGQGVGISTMHAIYINILNDALTTLDAMINHLEKQTT